MSETILVKRVKIRNILSHENTEITLPSGLIAFVGPNGAGKSSIIDSIIYALFVTPSAAKGIRGEGKKGILRIGASEGFIEVEMNVGGKTYIVQRFVSSQKPDMAYLIEVQENGMKRTLATGVQSVISAVEKLLSIPSTDAVRFSIISRQNELTKFIDAREAERKEIILKLLGLDELEKAKDILKEVLNDISKAKTLYDEKKRLISDAQKEFEYIEKELSNLYKKKSDLEKELAELNTKILVLEKAKDALYKYEKLKQAERVFNEIAKYERIEGICKEISTFDISLMMSKLEIYKNLKKKVDEVSKQLDDEIRKIQAVVQGLKEFLPLDQTSVENLDAYIKLVENKIDEIREKKQLKKAEIEINEKSINIIASSSTCPVCERPLDEQLRKAILAGIGNKIRDAKKIINEFEKMESRLREYVNSLKNSKEIISRLNLALETLNEQINKALEEYEKFKQFSMGIIEKAKLYDEFRECVELNDFGVIKTMQCLHRRAIESMKILSDRRNMLGKILNELNLDVSELQNYLQKIQKTLLELGIDIEKTRYEDLEMEYRKYTSALQRIRDELKFIEGQIKELENRRNSLATRMENLRNEIKKLEKDVEILDVLSFITNNVMGRDGLIARTLTKEARRLMELYTNAILSEFGMDFQIRIDDDFGIDVHSPLGRMDLRGLSGGETIALAIALRIALAYTIFGRLPGFFILDEPTQFLDEERRRVVFEIIKRLSQRMPQVIVVTHDREVIDLADRVFYVVKEGNKSIVREKSLVIEEIIP